MAELMEYTRILIEQVILALGYPGIVLVMLLENLFPPIPSELVMPLAGFLAGRGQADFAAIWAAGTLGAVLGALALYAVGYWADSHVVRRLLRRYGRWLQVDETDLDRVLAAFKRYGEALVLFGRLLPLVRSLISLPAGMSRMPLGKFLIFTTIGTGLWNGALAGVGLALGAQWTQVLEFVRRYETLTLIALGVAGAAVLAMWLMRWRRRQPASVVEVIEIAEE